MFVRKMNRAVEIRFSDLLPGDIFKHAERVCLKVSEENDEYNSYDFENNRLFILSEKSQVIYLPSELIVHD